MYCSIFFFFLNLPPHNLNSSYKMFNPMTFFEKVVEPKPMCWNQVSHSGYKAEHFKPKKKGGKTSHF